MTLNLLIFFVAALAGGVHVTLVVRLWAWPTWIEIAVEQHISHHGGCRDKHLIPAMRYWRSSVLWMAVISGVLWLALLVLLALVPR